MPTLLWIAAPLLAVFASSSIGAQSPQPVKLERVQLVKRFDADGDGRLEAEERADARLEIKRQREDTALGRFIQAAGKMPTGERPATEPIDPAQVPLHPDVGLFDPRVLRTVFLTFPNADWHSELADFFLTDVDIPATMHVDGRPFESVGVRYRGSSSYLLAKKGRKKSLNISVDAVHAGQRVHGQRTLNLLNGNADASMLREVLFARIAGEYLPTPRANFVRLVINGEDQGVYISTQQFNTDFLEEHHGSRGGTRWKVLRNYGGNGALSYLGDKRRPYRESYDLRTGSKRAAWRRLARVCRLLATAQPEELAEFLDVDRCLWFLALEWVFQDNDGYTRQGYDYRLLEDRFGRFSPVLYDNNEILPEDPNAESAARIALGQRPFGVDPLEQADNAERPLIHRLLAVPEWRARYLAHVRVIATRWLDWSRVSPIALPLRELIQDAVEDEPLGLHTDEEFAAGFETLAALFAKRRAEILGQDVFTRSWPEITKVEAEVVDGADGQRSVRVRATLAEGSAADRLLLYYKSADGEVYTAIDMRADGGGYMATTPSFDVGVELQLYVEARGTPEEGTASFHPEKAEAEPLSRSL